MQQKRHRISNLQLHEISSVDRPAQVGAVSVLMKSASGEGDVEYAAILKSASNVASGSKPSYSTLQYENAMLQRAELLARMLGVTPEKALAISLTSDSVLRELAQASEMARFAEQSVLAKRKLGEAA